MAPLCCKRWFIIATPKVRSQYLVRLVSSVATLEQDGDSAASPTAISRLNKILYRRLKNLPPKWELAEDRNFGPTLDYAKTLPEKLKHKERIDRKTYAKFGQNATDFDPSTLWPSSKIIEREKAKLEFFKPLVERIADMKAEKKQEADELNAHQKKIAERMSKMDEYMQQYKTRKHKRSKKDVEQIERREALVEEAREFFGYDVHHKDLKFQQMMEWKEEQEKRAKKKLKKESQQNLLSRKVAALTSELSGPSDDNPS